MDSSVSPKDEIWFMRVGHHFLTGLYHLHMYYKEVCIMIIQFTCAFCMFMTTNSYPRMRQSVTVNNEEGVLCEVRTEFLGTAR
jgi:hypothetical protein